MLLTWEFKSIEEAQEFLAGLVAKSPRAGAAAAQPISFPPGAFVQAAVELEEDCGASPVPAVEKKKRGPKPKAEKAAEEALAKVYGIEDCRAALSALFDAKGRDAAKAALAEFKVARIGELKADQYRGFIVLCETLSQPE